MLDKSKRPAQRAGLKDVGGPSVCQAPAGPGNKRDTSTIVSQDDNPVNQEVISNQSGDHKYFLVTPQIVWALSQNPYDFTLWNVIKMVAGDNGECWVSTENLAKLAMMSMGQVSKSRTHLINIGLLQGKQKRVEDKGQWIWHITIPDLWEANLNWRKGVGDDLQSRIEFKTEKSLHTVKAFCEKPSYSEGKPSPGETKKNHLRRTNSQEEPKNNMHAAAVNSLENLYWISNSRRKQKLAQNELVTNALIIEWCAWHNRGDFEDIDNPPGFALTQLELGNSPPEPKQSPAAPDPAAANTPLTTAFRDAMKRMKEEPPPEPPADPAQAQIDQFKADLQATMPAPVFDQFIANAPIRLADQKLIIDCGSAPQRDVLKHRWGEKMKVVAGRDFAPEIEIELVCNGNGVS